MATNGDFALAIDKMGPLRRGLFNSRWRARSQTRTITPTFLQLGGSLTDCKVLEVGCGCGVGIELLFGLMNAWTVDAIDIDPVMVALAAQRVSRRASVVLGQMGALPVRNCSYDAVVGFGALHLADDWRGHVREITRVLRHGGRFFFEQPINPTYRWAIGRRGGGRVPGGFGQQELVHEIEGAGLSILGLRRVGFGRLDLIGVAQKQREESGRLLRVSDGARLDPIHPRRVRPSIAAHLIQSHHKESVIGSHG